LADPPRDSVRQRIAVLTNAEATLLLEEDAKQRERAAVQADLNRNESTLRSAKRRLAKRRPLYRKNTQGRGARAFGVIGRVSAEKKDAEWLIAEVPGENERLRVQLGKLDAELQALAREFEEVEV